MDDKKDPTTPPAEILNLKIVRYAYLEVRMYDKKVRYRRNLDGLGNWEKWVDGYWGQLAYDERKRLDAVTKDDPQFSEAWNARHDHYE